MTQSQPTAALDHLRVLDLTNGLGQMCPRALGDLGADVIKVEPPEGDPTRRMAPFAGDEPGPERSLRFIHANRSKRSVVIDMDAPEGRDLVAPWRSAPTYWLRTGLPGTWQASALATSSFGS